MDRFRRAMHTALNARRRKLIEEMLNETPTPRARPLYAVEKWWAGITAAEACEGALRMARVLGGDRQRAPERIEHHNPYVNDHGEIIGMNWIMPDWAHFERMLDG